MDDLPIETLNSKRQQAYELLVAKAYRVSRELFEQVDDGNDPAIASCLGFIYNQRGSSEYDEEKALWYYRRAADQGHVYSQFALGGMLLKRKNEAEALEWYKRGSAAGHSACSYALYLAAKRRNDEIAARRFLDLAVSQGNAIAIQRQAIEFMIGRYGIKRIFVGLYRYFRNIPNLTRYVRQEVAPLNN